MVSASPKSFIAFVLLRKVRASAANAPHDVVSTGAQIVSHIVIAQAFERVEVQCRQPISLDEALKQIAHHPRMGEQDFVRVIVIAHPGFRDLLEPNGGPKRYTGTTDCAARIRGGFAQI
jgi:hypothetical protein